jgi:hypothetical protein
MLTRSSAGFNFSCENFLKKSTRPITNSNQIVKEKVDFIALEVALV